MIRASFIIWNMYEMPWCGSPTSQPWQSPRSPKLRPTLGRPRQPILWIDARDADVVVDQRARPRPALAAPAKRETPLMPGGAPSMRASIRWTMFSVRS